MSFHIFPCMFRVSILSHFEDIYKIEEMQKMEAENKTSYEVGALHN